ncbi:YibE/F family protein [Bacillus massilinigeriensis]|uniref:YibE/F family protein n=1 Tax=Bacillus mediterraneensis TaxID=1805474 RepID=UPI0008F8EF7C|nr:YibE/F family protein [Bacillus mediterraneensis]
MNFDGITNKVVFLYLFIVVCFAASMFFVQHNHSLYERPIAEITETKLIDSSETIDMKDNKDHLYNQSIVGELKNGKEKGQEILLENTFSASGTVDQEYRVGDDVFVLIEKKGSSSHLSGSIVELKRDTYILFVVWVFIVVLLLVGKKQGLFSIISLAVNALILSYGLDIYVHSEKISLLFISGISIILFTVISLLLINGSNEKTYAAIIATILGTFASLLITYTVMWLSSDNGLHYEEMQFLTRHYKTVFLAGLFIGSLGAVMDVAITMSSSIFGLYEEKPDISIKALKASGMEIGKDIMGTMTNILFFAYVSGSIPILVLYLKNGTPLFYTLSMNLSLELARALAGGIGIVLTIPIGLYISILLVQRKKARA